VSRWVERLLASHASPLTVAQYPAVLAGLPGPEIDALVRLLGHVEALAGTAPPPPHPPLHPLPPKRHE
jgi:hypothetical protein